MALINSQWWCLHDAGVYAALDGGIRCVQCGRPADGPIFVNVKAALGMRRPFKPPQPHRAAVAARMREIGIEDHIVRSLVGDHRS